MEFGILASPQRLNFSQNQTYGNRGLSVINRASYVYTLTGLLYLYMNV